MSRRQKLSGAIKAMHGSDRRLCAAITFLSAALFLSLGWRHSRIGAFWSPDSAVRFVMVRDWVHYGGSLVHPRYGALAEDPAGRFHPLGKVLGATGFVVSTPRGLSVIYPALFMAMSAAPYRLFGFYGLFILPAICGALTVGLVVGAASRLRLRLRAWLGLSLAVATPLPLYAASFWDLPLHTLVAAVACYSLVRHADDHRRRWGVLAGVALGVGVSLHEYLGVMLALCGIAGAATLPRGAKHPWIIGLTVGAAAPVVAWLAVNYLTVGIWLGPHLVAADPLLSGAPRPAAPGFMTDVPANACTQLLGLSVSSALTFALPPFALWLAAAVGPAASRQAALFLLPAPGLVMAVLIRNATFAYGLLMATPAIVLSFSAIRPCRADAPATNRDALRDTVRRFGALVWASFVMVVVVSPVDPGLQWGSRYLLMGLPWCVLLAGIALEDRLSELRHRAVFALPLVGIAVLFGLLANLQGWRTIVRQTAKSEERVAAIRNERASAVVCDQFDLGAAVAVRQARSDFYVFRRPEDADDLLSVLERRGATELVYFGMVHGYPALMRAGAHRTPPWTKQMIVRTDLPAIVRIVREPARPERSRAPARPRTNTGQEANP